MEKLTQKLLGLIVPIEITEGFEVEDIIETEKYVELVLREKRHFYGDVGGNPIEVLKYESVCVLKAFG